jgi:PAS domain S-box-containing protein
LKRIDSENVGTKAHPIKRLSRIARYLIFLALAAAILFVGISQFRRFSRNFEAEAMDELSSIARLKADQLSQWRKERLLDAASLDQNIFISVLVGRSVQAPADAGTQRRLQSWLQKYRDSGIYDRIQVLDRQGTIKLGLPDGKSPASPAVLQRLPAVLRTGRAEIVDFYLDAIEHRPFLNLLIPVYADGAKFDIEGILSLRIDPAVYLYPFIKQWPTASPTAETLIVRREGDDALFLNGLRFQTNAALNLRVPIRRHTIAGLAIEGREGIVEGIDYRGEKVFGCLIKIPESPWYLVARMDAGEVYAPVRKRLAWNLGILAVLLIALGLGIETIQRKQKVRGLRERLAAARNLQVISSRQEALLSALPEIIMEVDQNKIYVWANRPGLEFFGDDVIGKEASHYFEGEQDVYETVAPIFDGTNDVIYIESWQRRRDGRKRLLGWWCRSLKDSAGRTTGAISTARDITEERQAEESRREGEARYRTLVDNAPLAILVNRENRIVLVNDACLRLFGATLPEQLLGKSPFELFHPDCHAAIRDRMARMQNTGEAVPRLEEKIVRLDGVSVDVEATSAPFTDQGAPAIHVVLTDITERKRAADQSKAAFEAQASSLREKELLLQEVHHRVKNNLQIISSLLNLEAERVSPPVREIIKRSQTRIRSLSLVHEKLYRSADLTRIDLAGYIESLADHLFHVYVVDPSKVRLETDFEDVSLDINSAIPCGLILNEMISNALKHAFPDGRKGALTVRMKRTSDDFVELQVSDDGIGLPAAFDFDNPKSFGFQIMKLLVEQLEADFTIDRTRGTTFVMKFRELKYKPRI